MQTLIKNISSLVTVNAGDRKFKTGNDMRDIGEIRNGAVLFDDKIKWAGSSAEAEEKIANGSIQPDNVIEAAGKTVMPGFVDSHTHIVFGGNRSGEFARRLRGTTYQEIAAEGGGILTSVKGTRNASVDELAETAPMLAASSDEPKSANSSQ